MACLFIARLPAMSTVEAFEGELISPCGAKLPFLQNLKSKCRELARADSSVLVSPSATSLNSAPWTTPPLTLWIMTKTGHITDPKLKQKLHQLGVKLVGQMVVSQAALLACYRFSLTARLAPKWNQMTSWLVQVLDVGLTKTEITLSINVSKLTFNFLQPDDLEVSTSILAEFHSNIHSVIRERSICSNRCILIPNLTMGYIFSASHCLPHSTEFSTYDQIRVHWKKQHGFILPEKQGLFFQVFFKSNSGHFFSYPGCCVLKGPPITSSSRDTTAVAASFISDVHSRMPVLCGEAIRYSSKALVPSTSLQSATRTLSYPNVRPVASVRPSSIPKPAPCGFTAPSMIGRAAAVSTVSANSYSSSLSSSTGSGCVSGVCAGAPLSQPHKQVQTIPNMISGGSSRATTGQAVPIFCPHTFPPQAGPSNKRGAPPNTNGRIIPVFKPLIKTSLQAERAPRPSLAQPRLLEEHTATPSSFGPVPGHTVPHTTPPHTRPISGQARAGPMGNKHTLKLDMARKRPLIGSLPPTKHQCTGSHIQPTGRHNTPQLQPTVIHTALGATPAHLSQGQQVRAGSREVPDLFQVASDESGLSMESSFNISGTEGMGGDFGHSTGQHKRPPLQAISNRRSLIQVDGVSEETVKMIMKTRIPLLKKWLQGNGVKCSSRKKEDMVKMAALHIKQTGKTFSIPA